MFKKLPKEKVSFWRHLHLELSWTVSSGNILLLFDARKMNYSDFGMLFYLKILNDKVELPLIRIRWKAQFFENETNGIFNYGFKKHKC